MSEESEVTAPRYLDMLRQLPAPEFDPRGTVQTITPQTVLRAMRTIEHGETISIARVIGSAIEAPAWDGGPRFEFQRLLRRDGALATAYDRVNLWTHGLNMTHLDGPCHVGVDETWYGGAPVTEDGPSMLPWARTGIVARAILFDIPALRGADFVAPDQPVTANELDEWCRRNDVQAEPGDAILLCSGRHEIDAGVELHAAIDPTVAVWLADARPSIVGWDLLDAPQTDRRDYNVHFLIWKYGLALIDNCEFGPLVERFRALDRVTGALVVSPLPIDRATGCLVNPIVLY